MQRTTRKHIQTAMLMAVVAAIGAAGAQAQPPPPPAGGQGAPGGMRPGGPGGPGGRGMGRGGPFAKWGEEHKNVMGVSRKLRRIGEMNKTSDMKLNKQQSAKLLAIINTWKSKPSMSEDQAKSVDSQITALLNDKQRKELEARRPGGFGGGGGGMRPGGGGMQGGGKGVAGGPGGMRPGGPGGAGAKGGPGAPGGPGGPGGMRPGGPGGFGGGGMRPGGGPGGPGGAGFTLPKTINPLNPATMPAMMQERAKKSMDEFTADLQKQAK